MIIDSSAIARCD